MDIFYHPFERVFLIGTNNDCENDDDSETDCIFSTVSRERGSLCKMPLTPTQGSNASLRMHQMLRIQIYKYRIKYKKKNKKIYTHTHMYRINSAQCHQHRHNVHESLGTTSQMFGFLPNNDFI